MTRAVGDRILKDANGDIRDHLRNHIHLTNCIHLKNHMHKQSPLLSDRSLMRDLVVLQRSRSLKDPSMSPPSGQSPSANDMLPRRVISTRRWSVDVELQRDNGVFSGSSMMLGSLPTTNKGPGEVRRHSDGAAALSDRTRNSGIRDQRRNKKEESSGRNLSNYELLKAANGLVHDTVSGNFETRCKKIRQKGRNRQDDRLKTLPAHINKVPADGDGVASSPIHCNGGHTQSEKTIEEAEFSMCSSHNGLNKVKRRKYRRTRRNRASIASRDGGAQIELSVASNSFTQPKYHTEEEEQEYAGQNVTRAPTNGCGIPFNWSRIHHRGKTFLDIAGRSFSCGLSDHKLKKGGPVPEGRDFSNMPMIPDSSSSFTKSDGEAQPLLVDAFGSQESTHNAVWSHDYSGELGIFADDLLKNESIYERQRKVRGHHSGRHKNLTQKYMPRNFRDLVGQNLVAQALSNAIVKRKVGLLYVFYGPHGTGKTSCARIFARALNCQSVEHPKPCGYCNPCIAHDMGKIRNIREVGPVSNFDFESIMDLLDHMIVSQISSQYRVFIFDDCDTFSPDCWSAISKVIDRGPRRVVFVLVSSSPDVLPHIIISRCQKFFFPKLKDADIIHTLQWISTKEDLEIDKDALKLIASRSDGSLRDAEMTLDQLSLLGQRISVPLVQELVGLISDEKLVDLLDLALSADTVNTVRNLREIMESGVEPLALMSQLATVITDILAGSFDIMKDRPRRKFFRQQALSREDMEKLRQALRTLSEAEKQLRMSNDRLTWLTAALLQLAPDQQYLLPNSSGNTSVNHSPLVLNNSGGRERPRKSNVDRAEMSNTERELSTKVRNGNVGVEVDLQQTPGVSGDKNAVGGGKLPGKFHKKIEEFWLEALENIQINSLKEFMYQEGKMISVSFGSAPTVQLMFSSPLTKSTAEKFRKLILQAFESVLGSPVTIEIGCASNKDVRQGSSVPLILPVSRNGSNKQRDYLTQAQLLHFNSTRTGSSEIVEIEASAREPKGNEHIENAQLKNSTMASIPEKKNVRDENTSRSLVRSKVSLAHIIQQAEGCRQQSGWSKQNAISIAEKLEQENLRLEPISRSLLCWRASRITHQKLSRLKVRVRKPGALFKYASCGKCMSAKSPR